MPKIILCRGIQDSGKTTWAKQWALEGTLIDCNISINQDGTQIYYSAIYTSNKFNYKEEVHNIASSRLFSTKKKLLKSL